MLLETDNDKYQYNLFNQLYMLDTQQLYKLYIDSDANSKLLKQRPILKLFADYLFNKIKIYLKNTAEYIKEVENLRKNEDYKIMEENVKYHQEIKKKVIEEYGEELIEKLSSKKNKEFLEKKQDTDEKYSLVIENREFFEKIILKNGTDREIEREFNEEIATIFTVEELIFIHVCILPTNIKNVKHENISLFFLSPISRGNLYSKLEKMRFNMSETTYNIVKVILNNGYYYYDKKWILVA